MSSSRIAQRDLKDGACYLCGFRRLKTIGTIAKKPKKETAFGIKPADYRRRICLCPNCGVYNNFHGYDFENLYTAKYNKDTYKGELRSKYNAIMNLAPEKSDNKYRVKRIADYCRHIGIVLEDSKVLDVGSGLCVFLGEFLKYGIEGYCVDPDPLSVRHALSVVKVKEAYAGSFLDYKTDCKFDIITFNKILEHITDPITLLKKARGLLKDKGIVYIELPDGVNALANDDLSKREEFYIEHYMVFSERACRFLSDAAGLVTLKLESIFEPSGKYMLYAFAGKRSMGLSGEDR